MILPCISLHQPWASLVAWGVKQHETRHWQYPQRLEGQRIAIHAAKRCEFNVDQVLRQLLFRRHGDLWNKELPTGAVICTALLCGCIPTEVGAPDGPIDAAAGNWEPGRYAWRLRDVRELPTPIPLTGRQGWFSAEIPD